MTENQAIDKFQIIEGYLAGFQTFAEDCLFVRDHVTKQILPFYFNKPQKILHAIVEKQYAELGYVRALLDKARRFGGSTYIEGRGYWKTSLNFNINAFIVAHEEDSTDTLFAMARLFHERNPLKPQTKYSSKKELLFDTKDGTGLKSEYSLACAKTTSAGRSQGIHFLHGSELAFWEGNPDELLDGLMSCISDPIDTEVYLESTGNGYGNRFQRDVFDSYCEGRYPYYAKDGIIYAWKNPKSDWVLIFIPWFAHEIYTKPFLNDSQKKAFEDDIKKPEFKKDLMVWGKSEALELKERFGLTLEQLNWRAWMIENTFKGRVDKFRQEYPATVEESFLSQGTNVYPKELCDTLESACKEPLIIGDLVDRMGLIKIRPNTAGHFSLFKKPDKERSYVLTVDSAGGMKDSQKAEKREPDPSCIDVWDHESGEQVAQWHGHIDYDLIGDLVQMIGRLYGHVDNIRDVEEIYLPTACVELNQHGYTVVADLKKLNYPMYEYKSNEPGWSTNTKSKPQMVDALYEMARDSVIQIRCRETVSEMRTFVEKDMKFNAEVGCHDERVDTACMASMMMRLLPRRVAPAHKKHQQTGSLVNWTRREPEDTGYKEVYIR